MNKLILFATILILTGCKEKRSERIIKKDMFVFSFVSEGVDFSLKFTGGDSIYLLKKYPLPKETFIAIPKKQDKNSIQSLVNKLDFSMYDTIYNQTNLKDGTAFKFYKVKNDSVHQIYVYGHIAPEELYEIADRLLQIQKRQRWAVTNNMVDFGNRDNINYSASKARESTDSN